MAKDPSQAPYGQNGEEDWCQKLSLRTLTSEALSSLWDTWWEAECFVLLRPTLWRCCNLSGSPSAPTSAAAGSQRTRWKGSLTVLSALVC